MVSVHHAQPARSYLATTSRDRHLKHAHTATLTILLHSHCVYENLQYKQQSNKKITKINNINHNNFHINHNKYSMYYKLGFSYNNNNPQTINCDSLH